MYVSNPHRFYYLQNFHVALDWLHTRYADVLQAHEQSFMREFVALPEASRALLVRMIMRHGEIFRTGKLVYEEIGCVNNAAAPLLARGWLDGAATMTLGEVCGQLRNAEIRTVFACDVDGQVRRWTGWRRAAMLEQLGPEYSGTQPWRQWWPQAQEDAWRVTVGDLCRRLRLMFFGNLHQQWSEFVLADLGVFKYERVALSRQARAFNHSQDIDCWLALQHCREGVDEGVSFDELSSKLNALVSSNPWLVRRRDRVRFVLGQRAERAAQWDDALACYVDNTDPAATYRHARVLERAGRWQQALDVAQAAAGGTQSTQNTQSTQDTQAWSGKERPPALLACEDGAQKLARLIPRLQRRLGLARPRACADTRRQHVSALVLSASEERVERAVCRHLHTDIAPVFYVENSLVNGLFGLLCWEVVFADVPGAFFHPFQSGPADLYDQGFARRRSAQINAALASLSQGTWRDVVRERYAQKYGLLSPFVHWPALTPALLDLALACIPGEHLRIWIERLLADIRANRTGWPDLIQFFPERATYEMIEVKGPGDRLQDNQIRWLNYGAAHDMPMRVVHVRWVTATDTDNDTATAKNTVNDTDTVNRRDTPTDTATPA